MRRISSRATFFVKRPLLAILIGWLLFVLVDGLVRELISGQLGPLLFLIAPMLMYLSFFLFLYFVIKRRGLLDFADEVLDAGDALIVRNGNREGRIALADVISATYSYPYRVALMLRKPSIFGNRIEFLRPQRFLPFLGNRKIDELIKRVDALKCA